ncbi:MAG: 5-formyltetrahydrofolate cyclo-ligase, partial [Promethearchaeota archaeon]
QEKNNPGDELEEEVIAEISEIKKRMRLKIKNIRYSLPEDIHFKLSTFIQNNVINTTEFKQAKHICCYVHKFSTREVGTETILNTIIQDPEKTLVIPITRIKENRLDLSIIDNLDNLKPGAFNILEPINERLVEPTIIDMLIVPCIAVDRKGNRLGYGKGFFDGLISTLHNKIPIIALAFQHQTAYDVPHTPFDQPVTMFVTEKRTIRIHNPE